MFVLYMVAAWLIMQVAEVIIALANLPDWIGPGILALLAVGLPIALIFAWFYELTPEGIKLEVDVDPAESTTRKTDRRLDLLVIALLCAAVILFAFDKWWVTDPPDRSIAVLPFTNMSDDPEQEYFSEGISEEILNLLAKIPEMRVTSRSSAFSFKGQNVDIRTIATRLNVAHVLEGSVRKSGNQLRISAQLIEVESDTHLWSETYDRELESIFVIQNEIANEVVARLKIELLGELPKATQVDPGAYALYLQGRHLNRQRNAEANSHAEALLKQALEIDPYYAPAWFELGSVYGAQYDLGLRPIDEIIELVEWARKNALAFDPNFALAVAGQRNNDLHAVVENLQRALQLEPTNIELIGDAAGTMAFLGRLDEATELAEFVLAHDLVNPGAHFRLCRIHYIGGRWDETVASCSTVLKFSPNHLYARFYIGIALLFNGEMPAALETMKLAEFPFRMIGLAIIYHGLGLADESDAALEAVITEYEEYAAANIAYVFAYRGEIDRAFEWLEKAVQYKDVGLDRLPIEHLYSNLHDDPRWIPFLERLRLSPAHLATIEFEFTLPADRN